MKQVYHEAEDISCEWSVRQCCLVSSETLLYAPEAVSIAAKDQTMAIQKSIANLSNKKWVLGWTCFKYWQEKLYSYLE